VSASSLERGVASAPASSGNLGPGFDVLALALELRCRVTASPAAAWEIVEDATVHSPTEDDMVVRAVEAAVGRPMRLEIASDIPISRGLGSSSAVTVAAAAAAFRATGVEPDPRRLFEIVAELEGHGDNSAAAVYGGLVAVAGSAVCRLDVDADLHVVVGIPEATLPTEKARRALPAFVELMAASRNLARVVFLVEGLRTADRALLAAAGGDELHERPRAHLSPLTGELMAAALGAGALHAAWSGAGPSALAFATASTCDAVQGALAAALGAGGQVRCLDVATVGVR
jgi:homoserine kinase